MKQPRAAALDTSRAHQTPSRPALPRDEIVLYGSPMSTGSRTSTPKDQDPEAAARELLEGGKPQASDSDDSDEDGSDARGQSGTKGTGSAG